MRAWSLPLLALALLGIAGACASEGKQTASPTVSATTAPSPTPTPEPTPSPTASPVPKMTLWRWGNVTLTAPDVASQADDPLAIRVQRERFSYPDNVPALSLIRDETTGRPSSAVHIDAMTGEVTYDQVASTDQAEFDAIVATIQVSEPGDDRRPWPYSKDEPDWPKTAFGFGVLHWSPDPAAGIVVGLLVRESQVHDKLVEIENTKSRRRVDAVTGEVMTAEDDIAPEDAEAFERWTAALELGP